MTLSTGPASSEGDAPSQADAAIKTDLAARSPARSASASSEASRSEEEDVVVGTVYSSTPYTSGGMPARVTSAASASDAGEFEKRVRKHWGSPLVNTAIICLGVIHLLWGCRIGRQGVIGDCIIFGLILGVSRVGLPTGMLLAVWLSIVAWLFPRHALIVLAVLIASYMTWIGLWVAPGGPGTHAMTVVAALAMIVGFVWMVRLGVMNLHGATAAAGSFLGSSLIIAGVMQCSEMLTELMLDVVFYLPLMVVAMTALGLFYQLTAPRVDDPPGPVVMPRT